MVEPIFKEDSYRDLLQKVYLLAELKPGKTLSVREMTVTDHTFINSWYRWLHSEDRTRSVNAIFNIVDEVSIYLPCLKEKEEQRKIMYRALLDARKGIESLLETYKEDAKVCARVHTILAEVQRITGSFQWNTASGLKKNYSFVGLPVGTSKEERLD